MNGKENIINKILSDADTKCAKIIASAEAQAKEIVENAQGVVARDRALIQERIDATASERRRNRIAGAELDAKKYRLQAKQQLISRSYEQAYAKLLTMSESDRLNLIGTLIEKYAETGETVYVTQADAKGVTQMWLNGFEKKLKLGKKYLKADGGVVLEGEGYEKDLTLNSVIRFAREQTENAVAEVLLGEHDE